MKKMKRFVGYVIDKAVKAIPRSKKVSPDIKSVKNLLKKVLINMLGQNQKAPKRELML